VAAETEIKYRMPFGMGEDVAEIAGKMAQLSPPQLIEMHSRYYDTPDRFFGVRRWSFRCREENGRSVFTLKTDSRCLAGGLSVRGEWECGAQDADEAAELLIKQGAPEDLKFLKTDSLFQLCGVRFERRVRLVKAELFEAELCIDEGELYSGENTAPLSEVELELKKGSDLAMVKFANAIAGRIGLSPEKKSKFARARALGGINKE